jgi:hypothetical protein
MSRTPVQGGTPAAYRLARRLVIGMVVLVLLFCVLEGSVSGLTTGLACLGFFALAGLIAAASIHQTRVRRQRSFVRDLGGSLDRAREVLDAELVRSLQAERGDAVAAREIQRELPELSVAQIGELLRSL